MDQCVSENLRKYWNTYGPMIFYNTDGLELALFSLLFPALFFSCHENKQITIIFNVHLPELNNEIKINLPNKHVLECFLFEVSLLLTKLDSQLRNVGVNKLKRNTTYEVFKNCFFASKESTESSAKTL